LGDADAIAKRSDHIDAFILARDARDAFADELGL
jgi:hypothetical protein